MKINVKETVIFAMLGALMYMSKLLMDALPNIHLIGVFIVAITVVYRKKALYPIYIFVLIAGLLGGFSAWWVPYLYIWTVLWGMTMLLPKNLPPKAAPVIYMVVCSLHGFIYGILYAPAQALMFGLDFKGMLAWIAAGFPFDITHGISNFLCGSLIVPLIHAIRLADKAAKN
ncbi:MAG: hypothetical protein IJF20_00375 [Clostridia bacterium]|nr:hypothetical protein [Clostridia bacterium]